MAAQGSTESRFISTEVRLQQQVFLTLPMHAHQA